MFLVNLALADLLVTLICMPMVVGQIVFRLWVYGEFMCKVSGYMQGKHFIFVRRVVSVGISSEGPATLYTILGYFFNLDFIYPSKAFDFRTFTRSSPALQLDVSWVVVGQVCNVEC